MQPAITLASGSTTDPFFVQPDGWVIIEAGSASATLQYTTGTPADISNGTATWVTAGTYTGFTAIRADEELADTWVKLTAASGSITYHVEGELSKTDRLTIRGYKKTSINSVAPSYALDSSGNVTGLVGPGGGVNTLLSGQQYKQFVELLSPASLSAWNDQAGTGLTLALDTTVLFDGKPTLRLDIPANSSGTYRVGTTTANVITPYNWDGKQLALAFMSSNMTAVSAVAGVLLGDSTFTNYYTFTGQSGVANVPQANWVANEWVIARLGTTVATGSPTFTGIKRPRINFTVTSVPTATSVWIGIFGIAASKKSSLILSIDDGYASGYSFIAPLARYYKIPVSFGIDSALVGTNNYMTAAQIQELQRDPSNLFEFVTHGYNNHTINTSTEQAYVAEQVQTLAYLRSLGISGHGPLHHPWVQSLYSNSAQAMLKNAGFLSARAGATTPLSMHDSLMSTGNEKRIYQLCNSCTLTTGLSLAQAQTAITTACTTENYGVVHVNAHDFASADAASPPTWSYDKMSDLMGWIDAQRTAGVCTPKTWGQWHADLFGYVYQK